MLPWEHGDRLEARRDGAPVTPSPKTVFFFGDAVFAGLVSYDVVSDADYMIDYGNPNNNHGLPSAIA